VARTQEADVGDKLRPRVAGRSFLLVGDSIAALAREAATLLGLGAARTALCGDGLGLAYPPEDPRIPWRTLDVTAPDVAQGRQRGAAALAAPPAEIVAWLETVDPDRRAQVINYNGRFTGNVIAGRTVLGAPRREWIAIDDKTSCDSLWEAARVRRVRSHVVAAEPDALLGASARVDRGDGAVWAGDSHEGVNSGAALTRWIRNDNDAREALPFFATHCRRVRVMPFIEGTPCSVHAIVTANGTGVLRPCETLVPRDPDNGRFLFVGQSTGWDPADVDRDDMREAAYRVAQVLRAQVGYQGTFTLDGILGEDGFVPTEVNPRVGRGLLMMSQAVSEAGLVLHTKYLTQGRDTGLRVADVEQVLLTAIDARRALSSAVHLPIAPLCTSVDLAFTPAGLVPVVEPGDRDATLRCGPAHSYTPGVISLDAATGHVPVGPPAGPVVAAVLNQTREWLGVEAGRFEAAAPVR
jgi:ATP-grasp domain